MVKSTELGGEIIQFKVSMVQQTGDSLLARMDLKFNVEILNSKYGLKGM